MSLVGKRGQLLEVIGDSQRRSTNFTHLLCLDMGLLQELTMLSRAAFQRLPDFFGARFVFKVEKLGPDVSDSVEYLIKDEVMHIFSFISSSLCLGEAVDFLLIFGQIHPKAM